MRFPDPRESSPEGLVAVGGRMDSATLWEAYNNGIFPWPQEGMPLLWFSPDPRGVLDFAEIHIPKSLARFRRTMEGTWRLSQNEAFASVMKACSEEPRPGQQGTWIIPTMPPAYQRLHAEGRAMSVECWEGDELIGGIYGVDLGHYFSGESMFYKKPNASKLCLLHLIEILRSRGLEWMDVQMVTSVVESLGGKYVSRETFLARIGI